MTDLDEQLRAYGEAWRAAQPPVASDSIERAMERRSPRRVPLGLVAASILLVVIGGVLLAVRDNEQSLTLTKPGTTAPPATPCTASRLDIGFPSVWGAAAGTNYSSTPIHNTGEECILPDVAPTITADDASGRRVLLTVGYVEAQEPVVLPSGATGALVIGEPAECVNDAHRSNHLTNVDVEIDRRPTALTGLKLDLCDTTVEVFFQYPAAGDRQTALAPLLQDAVLRVRADEFLARSAETTFSEQGLSFIKGVAPSVSGRGARVYFFLDGRFAGTDGGSQDAGVVSNDGTTITIRYVLYKSTDAGCCPTGGEAIVRFEQRGDAVVAIDPLPGPWPETEPVGR
jgi:hypothetical protein